jgi:hypothetical protein
MAGIKVDYNGVQHRNTIPKRIRPKELAQAFLFPETSLTSFKCSSLRMALKNNTDDRQCRQSLCLLEKVIQGDENTKGWTEQAKNWIVTMSKIFTPSDAEPLTKTVPDVQELTDFKKQLALRNSQDKSETPLFLAPGFSQIEEELRLYESLTLSEYEQCKFYKNL